MASACSRCSCATGFTSGRVRARASIIDLVEAIFVSSDIIFDFLVLFEEQPEHAVQLLRCLDLHLGVGAHRAHLFLQIHDPLDVMLLKLRLIRHDVIVRAREVFLELVVEGLSGNLNADAQHDLNVDDLFFQGRFKDS